jgi:DNA polymerase
MFVGEAPGFYEDVEGRPFVGAAGQLLEELLNKVGLKRTEVYITNVVKCRPPGNRDPRPEELSACEPYLDRQIEAINPEIIVTLGRYSMNKFLPGAKISLLHGQVFKANGRIIIPMYHPAAALHKKSLKPDLEKDFGVLPKVLNGEIEPHEYIAPKTGKTKEGPQQLSLF